MVRDDKLENLALESLRSATAALHRQTERALDLGRTAASVGAYTSVLDHLLGFYEPLEHQLYAAAPASHWPAIDWPQRRKSPNLRADLASLVPGRQVPSLTCTYVPALRSPEAALGGWYVVEGATLGGSIIADHLAARLGLRREAGVRFFDSYGDDRDARWAEFCALLAGVPSACSDAVTRGAVAVFDAMHRWLRELPRGA